MSMIMEGKDMIVQNQTYSGKGQLLEIVLKSQSIAA